MNEEIDLGKLRLFMEIILWIKILSIGTFKMYLYREIIDEEVPQKNHGLVFCLI